MALSTLPYHARLQAHRVVGPVNGQTDELDIQVTNSAGANRGGVITYSVGRGQTVAEIRGLFQDAVYAQMEVDAGGRAALLDALVGIVVV